MSPRAQLVKTRTMFVQVIAGSGGVIFITVHTDLYALTEERSKSNIDDDELSLYSLRSSYLVSLCIVAFVHTSDGGHGAVSPSASGSNHKVI